ncbi:MAG: hypothetical protein WBH16_04785 [Candidatus Nanopelagicales bacterium]
MPCLTIRPVAGGKALTVRCQQVNPDRELARAELIEALAGTTAGSHDLVSVHHVATQSFTSLLREWTQTPFTSQGWECVLVPGPSQRREIRIPSGVELKLGLEHRSRVALRALHRSSPIALADPRLEPRSCYEIFVHGEMRGWIPVHRVNYNSVIINSVLHDPELFSDEPRRRSLMRLAAWSQAVNENLDAGHSVISWLPDDGDPINKFKFEVGAPAWTTHWVTTQVRRDLSPAT